MQIGHVRFSSVERHDHPFLFRIYPHIQHSGDFHQRLPQFTHAFIAILAFGSDFNRFYHRLIAADVRKWAGRINFVRMSWVWHSI